MRDIMEFGFARKSHQETHIHQNPEILYLLRGTANVVVGDEAYLLKKGDCLLINANKRHSVENMEIMTLFARFSIDYSVLTEYLGTNQILFWCNSVADKDEAYASLRGGLDQILNLYFEEGLAERFHLRSLYYKVIYLLVSNFMVKTTDQRFHKLGFSGDTRVFEIQNYIQANYQKQLSLNDLARQLYLTPAYLSKYIKKHLGMSFVEYLNNVRLFHAVDELLYTDKKVTRIAGESGFPATTSFNKSFRDCFGVTPSEYRQKYSGENGVADRGISELKELDLEDIRKVLAEKAVSEEHVKTSDTELLSVKSGISVPLRRPWGKILNIGEAALLLRSDIQEHVQIMKKELGFSHVRIWNVFSLIIYEHTEQPLNYNKLDRILDFLVGHGFHPYIDLGFKPKVVIQAAGKALIERESELLFTSSGSYEKVFRKLVSHLVNRYGIELMELWHFELWHDSRLQIEAADGRYYEIFDISYRILKKISANIKVGGAGFILGYENHLYETVFSIWKERDIRPDFLSVYSYGYVMVLQEGILYGKKSLDSRYTINQLEVLKQTAGQLGFEPEEIFVCEWNFTISNRNVMNDSCWKAAYVVKNCIDAEGEIDLLGYWHSTDLISEHYDTEAVMNGDSGLLTKEGIRKPAFFAFQFLSKLQPNLLGKNEFAMITNSGRGSYTIVCHNYKKPNYQYATKEDDKIDIDQQNSYFEDLSPVHLKFQIQDIEDGEYQIKSYYINQSNGSAQNIWQEIGYQQHLSVGELDYMRIMSSPHMKMRTAQAVNRCLELDVTLQPHEIRMFEIKYRY